MGDSAETKARRKFMKKSVICLALCAMLIALCSSAQAQQPKKIVRIGVLMAGHAPGGPTLEELTLGLRGLGWAEGSNISFELRFAEAKLDRLPGLAAELVRLNVDILVASAGAEHAAQQASKRIPIVFVSAGDPVSEGLAVSLARPGGNMTGLTRISPRLSGKRLELLHEAFPRVRRVAVFWNSGNSSSVAEFNEAEAVARTLRLKLQSLVMQTPNDAEKAFGTAARNRSDAVMLTKDPFIDAQHFKILDFVVGHKLPSIHPEGTFVEAGGLMSYGPNNIDLYRRAAIFVDKILKGTKPADIPVEQPMKFEFVINLKTAKQIGLTIPPNVLARASRVIK